MVDYTKSPMLFSSTGEVLKHNSFPMRLVTKSGFSAHLPTFKTRAEMEANIVKIKRALVIHKVLRLET